ncbi:conjugal transfer protein TraB [Streptomyces racemochromogenes]|uniref:conjugal transfer protein TraB n=1 Tax=Streptomyces racemochromogenes TaxID=67353 RepID=UPI0031E58D60
MTEIALTSDQNNYRAVQRKLHIFTQAMDAASSELSVVVRRMYQHAKTVSATADQLGDADGDEKYVDLTNLVAQALTEAAVATARTRNAAMEAAEASKAARESHRNKYAALDDVRTTRTTKTPKPGFWAY